VRILLALAAALVAAWLVVCGVLFVWPEDENPRRADAIVVLAGGKKHRLAKALELIDDGVSDTLVISDGYDPEWEAGNRLCAGARQDLEVICFRPVPYSTWGEAENVTALARRHSWRSLAVVTSRFHVFRARLIFERCFDGRTDAVAAPYSVLYLPRALVWETVKLTAAYTFRRDC
jgi:uncharacterized SAM-binding protein YcdF (DUF218 family)